MKSSFIPSDNILLVSDDFLMGIVNNGSSKDFFMLIKMRSISDIFDSLRAWESKMFLDLHGLLGVNISSDTNYLLTEGFQNSVVENQNARMLYDKSGNLVLGYIFVDNNFVIITSSEDAAHEIMVRLASNQTSQIGQ